MGTISSGTGLISGFDIEGVVNQLMDIERRPREQLVTRVEDLTTEQTALVNLQAQVLGIRIAAVNFNQESVFQQKTGTSSNEDALGITTTRFSAVGEYNYSVKRLATNHQLVSNGFSSATAGIGTGILSFEMGQGQLNRPTELNFINGQQGINRGGLIITDRSGATSEIDLSEALTIEDVIDEINSDRIIDVTAKVSGDHLVITDTSGGTNNLFIEGESASSLGINTEASGLAGNFLVGSDLLSVTPDTRLSYLNDGNGVQVGTSSDLNFTLQDGSTIDVDLKSEMEFLGTPENSTRISALNSGGGVRLGKIRITDQNGLKVDIDLSTLSPTATMEELKNYVETEALAGGVDVTLNYLSRDHISIRDNSEVRRDSDGNIDRRSDFIIEDLEGGFAAADLGIDSSSGADSIVGTQIYRMETLGDVVNAINNHFDNDGKVQVSINAAGTGLQVSDFTGGAGSLTVSSVNGTADDLGIITTNNSIGEVTGRRLIAGLNTSMLRSLNGGNAADPGKRITEGSTIQLIDRDGNDNTLDLTNAFSVQDVLDAINSSGTNITASLNDVGNGIVLKDSSTGIGNMTVSGDLADKLGISVDAQTSEVGSGNLQLQYISEASLLTDLRQGLGVTDGSFTINNRKGETINVNLSNDRTLGDVIDTINVTGGSRGIEAKINSDGDGLIIIDNSDGTGAMTIADVDGGTTAQDLGLVGTTKPGENFIDGSYEFKLDVGGGDNLEDIAARINEAGRGVSASIISDGDTFRLNLNSELSGAKGRIYLDGSTTNLSTTVLSEGQDALLLNNSLLIRSDSNSVQNVIKGATLEIKSVTDGPVNIQVNQDVESIIASVQAFVDAYNDTMDLIDEQTSFNPDTLERGVLFADSTVSLVKRNLQSITQTVVPGVQGGFNQLVQLGVKFAPPVTETGPDGRPITIARTPRLAFDESDFRTALEENPDGVAEFFTKDDVGLGDFVGDLLEQIAGQSNGTMKNRVDGIRQRQELFNDRIARLDDLLERKERRLFNQFFAMEQAIAGLQSQQSALASLGGLAAQARG